MIQLKVYPFDGATNEDATFLDLYETQPIKLTLSVEDITSADATSVFSRTFKVPANRHNNNFFENAWDIDGILFDITIKKPAQVLVDGAEFRVGHVRLQKIYTNEDQDKTDYELLFLGETRDFSSAIGEKRMCDMTITDFAWTGLPVNYTNAADFTGPFSYGNIAQSWFAYPQQASLTAGYADGDLLFPLINHGNTYDSDGDPEQPTIMLGNNSSGTLSFTQNNDAISKDRLKPMIRAKRLWDQIFNDSGYTYTSEFINSERFHQMYVSAFGNNESIVMETGQVTDTIFSASEPDNGNNDAYDYLYCSNVTANNGGAYTVNVPSIGSYFTAPGTASVGGSYYTMIARADVDFQRENSDYGYSPIAAAVKLVVVDSVGGNILQTLETGTYVINGNTSVLYYDSRAGGYQPQQGDIIQVIIDTANSFDVGSVGQASWECTAAPGNYYPLRDLDCEYNQIDFIKDIITMFRLVMQPDKDRPNNFIIEPWQDFIGSGETYDWSDKLIREKDFISEPLFNTQSAIIEFTKQEDDDFINSFHQDNTKHAYGWLRFDSANELLKGKRDVEVKGISPTPIDQIPQEGAQHPDADFIIPTIVEVTGEQTTDGVPQREAIKTNSRFLFYNGLIDINDANAYWNIIGAQSALQNYPLVSPYEHWPITADSLNLNWYNDTKYYLFPNPGAQYFDQGPTLFDEYWSRYINSLYNKFSRRVTAYFTLNNVDLQDLTFDDIIFIDGKYYRPEKIIDAQIGERTAVKVQLITYKDERPVWIDEPLTGFSIVATDGDCAGQGGEIQVTTNGTPPFTWLLVDNGYTGTHNATVGQAPYTFTIPNVPLGPDTLLVTDNNGRTAQAAIDIQASSGTPVTANWTETDATQCSSPCNGSITVVASGGTGSGYTITWQDPNVSGFTPNFLCPGDYMFYITDSDGCQSDTFTATISCTVQTYVYQLREHLNNCSQSSVNTYIAESTQQIPFGTTVDLLERSGCYYIQSLSKLQPNYTIDNTYASCAACSPTPVNSYEVQNCTNQNTLFIGRGVSLTPGQVVELNDPNNPGCWEVVGDDSAQPTDTVAQVYTDCNACTSTPPGFIYYAFFCSGVTSPRYFASSVARQSGDIVEVTSGTYNGECVEIISLGSTQLSEGDLGTTVYNDCDACQGLTPQTCKRIDTGLSGAEIQYSRQGQTYTESLNGSTTYYRCTSTISIISGTATITDLNNLCISDFDCIPRPLRTSCHNLYGGSYGSTTFEYQDSTGTFVFLNVNAGVINTVCAVINSVTVVSGGGSFMDLQSLCQSDIDCDTVGPGDPIP